MSQLHITSAFHRRLNPTGKNCMYNATSEMKMEFVYSKFKIYNKKICIANNK